MKSFKEFVSEKNIISEEIEKKDWRKEYLKLEKGFVPPSNLRPVIQAFLDSGSISLTNDLSSKVTMPKKSLFLVGGPVRDFLLGKKSKDLDLATNATPEQIALILHNAGFSITREDPSWDLPFKPKVADDQDNKKYYLKGRDSADKPFVVGAVVNGEEFDIATFRKDAKTVNGQSEVDFVDNPHEDAERRDFTINAMYIELNKADGENNKLYDPTKSGYHDIHSGTIRAVGKAEARFDEDKLRVMRAIRMQSKYGKQPMDVSIKDAISKFSDLDGVALERVREEFLKGLEDVDIDPRKYISLYSRLGLLKKVLPGVHLSVDVPLQLRDKKDKFLALAWILKENPTEMVGQVLGRSRKVGEKEAPTGWSNQERDTVVYLLRLKEFDKDQLDDLINKRKILGITKDQIRKWVELFDVVDKHTVKTPRPDWAKSVKKFADFSPDPTKLVSWYSRDEKGNPTKEVHPEIKEKGLDNVPPHFRGTVIKDINKGKLQQMFDTHGS
jgi:tRNA nucleotidyltransferase/poly(A) polymerase